MLQVDQGLQPEQALLHGRERALSMQLCQLGPALSQHPVERGLEHQQPLTQLLPAPLEALVLCVGAPAANSGSTTRTRCSFWSPLLQALKGIKEHRAGSVQPPLAMGSAPASYHSVRHVICYDPPHCNSRQGLSKVVSSMHSNPAATCTCAGLSP